MMATQETETAETVSVKLSLNIPEQKNQMELQTYAQSHEVTVKGSYRMPHTEMMGI